MKKTTRMTKKRPVEVIVEKGQQIPIYSSPVVSKGKKYESFTVAYIQAGARVRRRAATIEEARVLAASAARQLAEGAGHVQTLTPSQVADYHAADKIIRQNPGQSLAQAIAEWAAARKALGGGSIVAACEAQRKATLKRTGFTQALVSSVYDEFIASLERDGASDRYIDDCKSRMGQIKNTFGGYIHTVERADLERWLNEKKISIKTRKNYRTAAVTLWGFAKSKGYLPPDQQTEAELIPIRKRTKAARLASPIGTYEAADLRKILASAPAHLLPVFALGAFAGLRSSEIHRLKWGDIRPSFIEVSADDSKNAVRRHAPMPIALKQWLEQCTRGEGEDRICAKFGHENALARAMTKAIRDAGVQPVHNGLRHTFCSARVAATNDVKQTSREAGNSPSIILQHYVKVMTKSKASAWFGVRPSVKESSSRVVAFAA
jgi:integrase